MSQGVVHGFETVEIEQHQTEGMLQRNEQISTQKRINRPSDDPAGMARVLDGRLAALPRFGGAVQQLNPRLTHPASRRRRDNSRGAAE